MSYNTLRENKVSLNKSQSACALAGQCRARQCLWALAQPLTITLGTWDVHRQAGEVMSGLSLSWKSILPGAVAAPESAVFTFVCGARLYYTSRRQVRRLWYRGTFSKVS